jgi:hypothetical protein
MFWMPRSPYFLVFKDDLKGAKKSLQFLRGKKAKVDGELEQIKEEVAETKRIGSISLMTVDMLTTFVIKITPISLDLDETRVPETVGDFPGAYGPSAALRHQLCSFLLTRNIRGRDAIIIV